MEDDYYKILGVPRSASEQDIQKAYRKLARQHHPDLAEDKDKAKEKFQTVQQAFSVLSDPEKRKLYDKFGSSYERMAGNGGQPFGGFGEGGFDFDFSQMFGGAQSGAQGGGGGGFEDILRQFAGGGGGAAPDPRGRPARPGRDVEQEITVPFQTAIQGGKVSLSLQRGSVPETITVTIPAAIDDGKKIRLKGQGEPSATGGPPGDLFIRVRVASHPYFSRKGKNLLVRIPVSLSEAWLGGKITVPTPDGTATLTVPPRSNSGRKLRLKGQGVRPAKEAPGDLLVELEIQLPQKLDADADEQIKKVCDSLPQPNLRNEIRW